MQILLCCRCWGVNFLWEAPKQKAYFLIVCNEDFCRSNIYSWFFCMMKVATSLPSSLYRTLRVKLVSNWEKIVNKDHDESGNIFTFFALQNIACHSVKLWEDFDSEEKWVHAKENSLVWQVTYFLCVDQWRNLSH